MSEPAVDRYTLRALGTPELLAPDGRRVGSVLAQPKRLALLTYLAMAPAPVSRATLVETFWPDSDDTHARNALSQALFHLRRALGDDVVVSVDGNRLEVAPDRLWCDAREALAGRAEPGPGELLEGWSADDAAPMQAWLDTHRGLLREVATRRMTVAAASTTAPESAHGTGAGVRLAPARRVRWGLALTAAAALAAVAIAVPRLSGRPAQQELAVLMPRVSLAAGAPAVDAQLILDEVLAQLPDIEGVSIVPAPSAASVPAFRTQLTTIGAPLESTPDWILEVSVRVAEGRAAVVALLYRSPQLDVPGRESFDVTYGPSAGHMLESPRDIARGVAAMVERVLGPG